MLNFHMSISTIEVPLCLTCLESFPGLTVSSDECNRCHRDSSFSPKLYSHANNMDPGEVPHHSYCYPFYYSNQLSDFVIFTVTCTYSSLRLAPHCLYNHLHVVIITSTFIECRGEPELIFVQFDNSIIKLIIKHQQYQATRRYR